LAIQGRALGLERRAAALLVVAGWTVFPILVAIPLADITEISFVAALFQSMSSFTTTGSLVFINLETVPRSIIFLLAQFQWMGGLATLITFVLILSPWEIGGLPKMSSTSEAASIVASDHRILKFCGNLFRIMLGITIACFVLLLIAGVPPYESIVLSMTAISTGGIVPTDTGLDLILGNDGMVILGVFFMIGATSIFWHRYVATLRLSELIAHRESYFAIGGGLAVTFFITLNLINASGGTAQSSDLTNTFSESFLNAASLISTSGVQSRPGVFALLAPTLVVFVILVGGGSFSTAGGLKLYRIGLVIAHAMQELERLIYPNSLGAIRHSGKRLDLPFLKRIWGFISIWVLIMFFSALLLNVSGLDFQAGFTVAVAALSNAGPAYGAFWDTANSQGWLAYSDMSNVQLLVLTVLMFLGRIEIIVVIASLALLFRQFR